MNSLDTRKINRQVTIKRVLLNTIFTIFVLFFLYSLFNTFFPNIVSVGNKHFKIVLLVVFIYLVFKSYRDYCRIMEHLELSDLIREIKREDNAENRLYYFMMFESGIIDKTKVKIDILKSFTPVPFVIFLLGVLWDSKFKIITGEYSKFLDKLINFDISIEEIFILIMFLMIFYYAYSFRSAWLTYKSAIESFYKFKYEYDILKNVKEN